MSEFKHPEPGERAIIIHAIAQPERYVGREVMVERYCSTQECGLTARNSVGREVSRAQVAEHLRKYDLVVVTGIEELLIPTGFRPGLDVVVWPRQWLMKIDHDRDVESEREQKLKEYET